MVEHWRLDFLHLFALFQLYLSNIQGKQSSSCLIFGEHLGYCEYNCIVGSLESISSILVPKEEMQDQLDAKEVTPRVDIFRAILKVLELELASAHIRKWGRTCVFTGLGFLWFSLFSYLFGFDKKS